MRLKYMFGGLAVLALLAGSVLFIRPVAAQEPMADLILHNGKVLTVDDNFTIAQAVAIAGNKIIAVGTNDEVLKKAGPNTQKIDLQGKTVTPGLIDSHRHMYSAAEQTYGGMFQPQDLHRYIVDWKGVSSKQDVLNEVKAIMDQYKFKPGQWIYFANALPFLGNNQGTIEQAKILYDDLNQWELDKVIPNNPAMMSLGIPDFNGLLLNKKAMDIIWPKSGTSSRRTAASGLMRQAGRTGTWSLPRTALLWPSRTTAIPRCSPPCIRRTWTRIPPWV